MRQRACVSWAAVVAALVVAGCGSDSPTGSSTAGGVAVQGLVLAGGTSSVAAADTGSSTAQARKTKVRIDGTSLSVDVSANGTFEFKGVASGTFTLVFEVDGVEVGRVIVSAAEGSAVKIVVQVQDSVLVVVELKVEGPGTPSAGGGNASSGCVVNGGKAGSGIELEGRVASGDSSQFNLTAPGRASTDVVVNASSATFRCVGSTKTTSDAQCKALVKAGAQVHVRGTMMSCSAAQVTAIEVKVQKG